MEKQLTREFNYKGVKGTTTIKILSDFSVEIYVKTKEHEHKEIGHIASLSEEKLIEVLLRANEAENHVKSSIDIKNIFNNIDLSILTNTGFQID